jgi:hypothetical protein
MVAKPTAFQVQITGAAEQFRKKLCDTYFILYWLYKNNISFNTGPKVKKVPPSPQPPHDTHNLSCFQSLFCLVFITHNLLLAGM